jgi:hypothetical protein
MRVKTVAVVVSKCLTDHLPAHLDAAAANHKYEIQNSKQLLNPTRQIQNGLFTLFVILICDLECAMWRL